MTRTEAIAQAIADQLRSMSADINGWRNLRGMVFDVKLIPNTNDVRAVLLRPEFEHEMRKNVAKASS